MKKPALITAKWLLSLGACEPDVDTFRKMYPKGMQVTLTSLRRCARAELDIDWLAHRLWYGRAGRKRKQAWAKYDWGTWHGVKNQALRIARGFVLAWRAWKEE